MTDQQQSNLVAIATALRIFSRYSLDKMRVLLLEKLDAAEQTFVLDGALDDIILLAEKISNGNVDPIPADITACPSIFSVLSAGKSDTYIKPTFLDAKNDFDVDEIPDSSGLIMAAEKALHNLHRETNLNIFVDDLDTFAHTYLHAIHATHSVPFYDHLKQSMAFSVALWHATKEQSNLSSDPFVLVQGDFFGIQKFIFASNPEHNKKMAQILRGKSAGVTLLMEMCIINILDSLELSPVSLSRSAAGKFIIIAPATTSVLQRLEHVKRDTEQWFLEHFYGEFGIGISWIRASIDDFSTVVNSPKNIKHLMGKAAKTLEYAKSVKFALHDHTHPVFASYLDSVGKSKKICPACDRRTIQSGEFCVVCGAFRELGSRLSQHEQHTLWICRSDSDPFAPFGYVVRFASSECQPVRRWDIRLPEKDGTIYHGYARRTLKAYTPAFQTFEDLASHADGTNGLIAMKADIDNLGLLFGEKIHSNALASFAKSGALSRVINHFFTHRIAYLLSHTNPQFRNIYTVFAGGDDLFLIGTWNHMLEFANVLKDEFDRYFHTDHTKMSFSAGLAMFKSGVPVPHIAHVSETNLEDSKNVPGKGAITLFGESVPFAEFGKLMAISKEIEDYAARLKLSSGYLRSIVTYAEEAQKSEQDVFATRWVSHFRYNSQRNVIEKTKEKEMANAFVNRLGSTIQTYKGGIKLAMFPILYKQRGRK